MLSEQPRITPTHMKPLQRTSDLMRTTRLWYGPSARGGAADTGGAADGAHAPRPCTRAQRRHCEPVTLQVCSQANTAHWVTIRSSRVTAALQAACSGAEGALPREVPTPTGARLAMGRTDRCSTGVACQQPSTPRTRPSLCQKQRFLTGVASSGVRRQVVKDFPGSHTH